MIAASRKCWHLLIAAAECTECTTCAKNREDDVSNGKTNNEDNDDTSTERQAKKPQMHKCKTGPSCIHAEIMTHVFP